MLFFKHCSLNLTMSQCYLRFSPSLLDAVFPQTALKFPFHSSLRHAHLRLLLCLIHCAHSILLCQCNLSNDQASKHKSFQSRFCRTSLSYKPSNWGEIPVYTTYICRLWTCKERYWQTLALHDLWRKKKTSRCFASDSMFLTVWVSMSHFALEHKTGGLTSLMTIHSMKTRLMNECGGPGYLYIKLHTFRSVQRGNDQGK